MKKVVLIVFACIATRIGNGQDRELMNSYEPEKVWYLEPWLWIGSGVLLLLIMLSLLLRISKSTRKKETTTDETEPSVQTTDENTENINQI